jgi:hypothetical protein
VETFAMIAVDLGCDRKTPELMRGAVGQDFCENFDLTLEVPRGGMFF